MPSPRSFFGMKTKDLISPSFPSRVLEHADWWREQESGSSRTRLGSGKTPGTAAKPQVGLSPEAALAPRALMFRRAG
jgi:hypothetical protein